MTDTINITVDDAAARAVFAELVRRGTDMQPLLRKAVGHLVDVAEEAFDTERSPDGVPWVDLAARTIKAREKRGHWPGKKLQVRGTLALSIGELAKSAQYGPNYVEVGSNLPYARIHQKGGQAGRGGRTRIPARPFLGLSDEAREAIQADMIEWVDLNRQVDR